MTKQFYTWKFPLEDTEYGFNTPQWIEAAVEGQETTSLWGENTGIPSGGVGMTIDGVPIYPSLDNAGYEVWEACEADYCSANAGRSMDCE